MKLNEIQWNSMKINENRWKSMKIDENLLNHESSMKIDENRWNQWNSMKINFVQFDFHWGSMTGCPGSFFRVSSVMDFHSFIFFSSFIYISFSFHFIDEMKWNEIWMKWNDFIFHLFWADEMNETNMNMKWFHLFIFHSSLYEMLDPVPLTSSLAEYQHPGQARQTLLSLALKCSENNCFETLFNKLSTFEDFVVAAFCFFVWQVDFGLILWIALKMKSVT